MQAQERRAGGRKPGAVRDFLLNEALKRLATEAATRFSCAGRRRRPDPLRRRRGRRPRLALLQLPAADLAASCSSASGELRSLPAFGPARDAVEEAGVAAPYLEARGEPVPAEPGERAARMLTIFIASLWDGCTEFSLDRERSTARSRCSTPRPATPTRPTS